MRWLSLLSYTTLMASNTELTPFSQQDFVAFYQDFIPLYTETMLQAHMFKDRQEALTSAQTQMAALFPEGLESKGQHLLNITQNQENIGYLWYAEKLDSEHKETGRLCYVYITPPFRNRGYAKDSIQKTEVDLKSRGISRLGLNVFSTHSSAKKLYESLGYRVVRTFLTEDTKEAIRYEMSKDL
jgi:ribosomal protein S18 acetylase RimI-like enzyme